VAAVQTIRSGDAARLLAMLAEFGGRVAAH
jgi:hypothetical protein